MATEELTLREKVAENQTVEKSALLVAGTTILPVGLALIEKSQLVEGIILVLLGVACIVGRELLKLRSVK